MNLTVENMKEKDTKPSIYYANKYIQLGKSFNVLQKRVIHFVVDQLQAEIYGLNQQKANHKPIQRTLFGDAYFRIPTRTIDPENQDNHIRQSLRGLKIPIDDKDFIGDFMLSAKREQGDWVLLFPEKTVHFLTEVSKGITPLQTIVYLSAQSKYTIRMYELLMRFRDTGLWYTTPEELCYFFELSATYQKDYGRLKQSVLEVARKEIEALYKKNQSDIYFIYEETRGGRGNKVKQLKFSIFWREKAKKAQEQTNTDFLFVNDNLRRIMVDGDGITPAQKRVNEEFVKKAMSKLVETANIKHFAEKLEKKVLENPKVDFDKKGALARYILVEDYGVQE